MRGEFSMSKFTLPENERKQAKELDKLLKFGLKQINKVKQISFTDDPLKDLMSATTLQMVCSAHYLISGILAVSKKGLPEIGIILLRTLLESSITTMYIAMDTSGRRVRAFYLTAEKKRLKTSEDWLSFINLYPQYEKSLSSKANLQTRINQLKQDIKLIETRYGKLNFPDLKARALTVDKKVGKPDNEFMYVTVYKYFSDFTHLSALGLNALLKQTQDAIVVLIEPHSRGSDMLLVSSYGFYFAFLERLNEEFSLSLEGRLKHFSAKLKEISGGKVDFHQTIGNI